MGRSTSQLFLMGRSTSQMFLMGRSTSQMFLMGRSTSQMFLMGRSTSQMFLMGRSTSQMFLITVLSDGVHKSDRKFAFSGRIRPRRRCFRLVKATPLVQIVDSGLSGV